VPWGRVGAIAVAVIAVLWASLDAGFGDAPPAPPVASAGLLVLAVLFGAGTWVMRVGGRPERAPLLAGLSIGAATYALLRLTLPG
jgi:uncharacterized membrane protein